MLSFSFPISNPVNSTARVGFILLCVTALGLSGCAGKKSVSSKSSVSKSKQTAHINNKTKFSSKEYGVKGSPRVTTGKKVRKGGGRYQVGKPYTIRGKRYYPKEDKNLKQVGMASWYGPNFHGRLTANGEIYDQYALSAAHPTMPLPSYAKVTNLENGRSLTVRVNDRGPYSKGRIIDLSARAAKMLDYTHKGVTKVKVEYVGKARMDGLDEKVLLASYAGPGKPSRSIPGIAEPVPQTMIASAKPINRPSASVSAPIVSAALLSSNGVDANGSINAISNSFEQKRPVPLSSIPVPTARPVVFYSDQNQEEAHFRLVRRPLAFANQNDNLISPRTLQQYILEKSNIYNDIKLYSDEIVELKLGQFKGELEIHVLFNLLENAAKLRIENGFVFAAVTENKANMLLDYCKEIGLNFVTIL